MTRIKLLEDRAPHQIGDVIEASKGLTTYLLFKGWAVEAPPEEEAVPKPIKKKPTKKKAAPGRKPLKTKES